MGDVYHARLLYGANMRLAEYAAVEQGYRLPAA